MNQTNIQCPIHLEKMNKHQSETEVRVWCRKYEPIYCQNKPRKICKYPNPEGLIVNIGKRGDIEVSKLINGKIKTREYAWNRLPPLQKPLSNIISPYISRDAWTSDHFRKSQKNI